MICCELLAASHVLDFPTVCFETPLVYDRQEDLSMSFDSTTQDPDFLLLTQGQVVAAVAGRGLQVEEKERNGGGFEQCEDQKQTL